LVKACTNPSPGGLSVRPHPVPLCDGGSTPVAANPAAGAD
jgi:hypothetical protein